MKGRTFRLNKLVRDKIIQDHVRNGAKVKSRRLTKGEKQAALLDKIIEEAREYSGADNPVAELADIQEIIDRLAADGEIAKAEIKTEQDKKRAKNGGFSNGDYIEQETWPADHRWAKYYAKEPERFPEVKDES